MPNSGKSASSDDGRANLIARLVNQIFSMFRVRCRNWQRDMPDAGAVSAQKNEYIRLLAMAGIFDGDVILRAAEHVCSVIRWYQLPDDFVRICQDIGARDRGIPDDRDAFQQAVGIRTKKHPAVRYMLAQMGDLVFTLRRSCTNDAQLLFDDWWSRTKAHVAAGGELPEPAPELEHTHVKARPEAVAGHRAALLGLVDDLDSPDSACGNAPRDDQVKTHPDLQGCAQNRFGGLSGGFPDRRQEAIGA